MMAAKADVARVAPRRSSGRAVSPSLTARLSGIRDARRITTRASGRFNRKISRQDHTCISQPPATGPSAAKTLVHADQVPIARPRRSGSKDAERMESPCGINNAAPIPCTARAVINWAIEVEAAQAAEASAKSTTPHRNVRRRPYRSPMAPPSSSNAALNKA